MVNHAKSLRSINCKEYCMALHGLSISPHLIASSQIQVFQGSECGEVPQRGVRDREAVCDVQRPQKGEAAVNALDVETGWPEVGDHPSVRLAPALARQAGA